MFIAILAFAAFAHADQDVKLVNPDTFCKIETFAAQKGKAPSGNYKKCDSLKDKAEVQVKSMSECKQRALTKGEDAQTTGTTKDSTSGRDVPSILLDPQAITKDNVKTTVVADGFWKADELCAGAYKDACTAAQIQ